MKPAYSLLAFVMLASSLSAQTLIEYGKAAGTAGATAAAGSGVGKGIGSVFEKVGGSLQKSADPSKADLPAPSGSTVKAVAAKKDDTPVATTLPDPDGLPVGMDRKEMIVKFGRPSMSITSSEREGVVETCWYKAGGATLVVTLRDSKVISVSPPAAKLSPAIQPAAAGKETTEQRP